MKVYILNYICNVAGSTEIETTTRYLTSLENGAFEQAYKDALEEMMHDLETVTDQTSVETLNSLPTLYEKIHFLSSGDAEFFIDENATGAEVVQQMNSDIVRYSTIRLVEVTDDCNQPMCIELTTGTFYS